MTEKETVLYEWLRTIDPEVLEKDEIPLTGLSPPFPWEDFSENISQAFQTKELKIEKGEVRWLESDQHSSDLGNDLFVQGISLSSMDGEAYFAIDLQDLRFLMYALLTQKPPSDIQIFDEELEKGFYQYLSLEAARYFSEVDFDDNLSPHLLKDKTLPGDPLLGVDVNISMLDRNITSRLLIDSKLLRAWREHFSERSLTTAVSRELLKKLEVSFRLQIGGVDLSRDEIKSLEKGDLVLLDQCYVDPESHEGQVILSYNGKPKIRASLEKNHVKIMESPLFYEELSPLVKGGQDNG